MSNRDVRVFFIIFVCLFYECDFTVNDVETTSWVADWTACEVEDALWSNSGLWSLYGFDVHGLSIGLVCGYVDGVDVAGSRSGEYEYVGIASPGAFLVGAAAGSKAVGLGLEHNGYTCDGTTFSGSQVDGCVFEEVEGVALATYPEVA
jgi:hypothetical protein